MNKDIPEGGRHVKCARCGNQWRLVPEGFVEETIELDEPEHNQVAPQPPFSFEQSREPATPHEPEPLVGEHEPAGFAPWQSRREHFADTISTLSEPQAMNYGDAADESVDEVGHRHSWEESDADEPRAEPVYSHGFGPGLKPPADDDDNDERDSEPEDAAADEPDAAWEARMNRPWREIVEASRMGAEEEEEDTETAIRDALKAALEHPGEEAAPIGRFQEQFRGHHDENPGRDVGWHPFPPRDAKPQHADDETYEEAIAAVGDADHPPFTIPGHDPATEAYEEDEAPFRLTGQSARRPVYQADGDEDREAEYDDENAEEAAARNAGFEHDIEDAFRAAPRRQRGVEPGQRRHDETQSDFDRHYDEQAAAAADQLGPEFYDEDATAALQAQLESTDLAAYETRPAGGGLAVAAAWAVFFSVLSGVALALVTLRSEIMASLPGTTSLYRAIGFDVAESGIDFADVSYRWTMAQGKPMIEVKGQVVNVTDRRLTVPRVLINVRDSKSQDAVKVTASVPTESLAPRESASFTLEFVSPPKNISQIELEFDYNR
jgi:hypothetical protein